MSDTTSQENSVTTSTADHATASPGELLLRQREQLNIPLADAARALNLRPAVIGGLERDDYQEIPVAAYRRGYLRAYAKFLGMDDRVVLDAYQARNGIVDTERKVAPVSTTRPPSKIGAWLFKLVTLLVVVGLIGVTVMWWQSRGGNEPPGLSSTPTEEATPATPTMEEPAATTDEGAASSSFTNGEQSATLLSDAANITPTPAPSQSTGTGAEETTEPANVPAAPVTDTADEPEIAAAEQDTPTEVEEPEPAANANVLELTFNEQSWTEIFDATNQRVFVGLQTPGTTTTVEGQPPFRLTVGNATGVVLRYQGEEVDLPARAGANNVARFTLGE